MRFRYGLQARFVAAMAVVLLVVLAVVGLMWQRQRAMQQEVSGLGRESMHALVFERMRRRGESMVAQLAESLTNPMYYSDLDAIGVISRNILRQPDVSYVLEFDPQGRIVHDGSGDIPAYGQPMNDPFAFEVIAARAPHTQTSEQVVDIASPIMIGDQRLGGVRVGYSLASMRADETRAADAMHRRLAEIGDRHRGWIGLLGMVLIGLGLVVVWLLQRTLVRPIRQLADVAGAIEGGNFEIDTPVSSRGDEVGDLVRAFGRMSSSVARHDRDIRRMAYSDALTGLANRLQFREKLDQRLLQLRGAGRQLALLFADIDDFKRVNDTLGHDAGDDVLVQFSNRIREAVKRMGGESALLARFGGDEFVILIESVLSPTGKHGDVRTAASRLAEALVAELSRPIVVQERQVFLGTSIGITLFPEDASGSTMLMKNGDIAMYQAKVAGKNC